MRTETTAQPLALAVKVLEMSEDVPPGSMVPPLLLHEMQMLASMQRHPNLVACHGLCRLDGRLLGGSLTPRWGLVMDFCPGGDLFSMIEKSLLTEARTVENTSALLSGLAHIHAQGIVHRDVKPENVLFARDGKAVLVDFGVAAHMDDHIEMARKVGSLGYCAPEIITNTAYDEKVDCFSVGVTLFFMLYGRRPFTGKDTSETAQNTVGARVRFSSFCRRFPVSGDGYKVLIRGLLQKTGERRPTAEQALGHPWLTFQAIGEDYDDAPSTLLLPRLCHHSSDANDDPRTPRHRLSRVVRL